MRGVTAPAIALVCLTLVSGCGGGSGSKPAAGSRLVKVQTQPNYQGTLKDLASQVTTNVILTHHGARFVQSVPFAPCPGEAGIQTFAIHAHGRTDVLEVAFTNWNGSAVTAEYQRPQKAPYDKQALDALRHAVCSS